MHGSLSISATDTLTVTACACRMPRLTRVLCTTLCWLGGPPVSPRCRACCLTSSTGVSSPRASTLMRLLPLVLLSRYTLCPTQSLLVVLCLSSQWSDSAAVTLRCCFVLVRPHASCCGCCKLTCDGSLQNTEQLALLPASPASPYSHLQLVDAIPISALHCRLPFSLVRAMPRSRTYCCWMWPPCLWVLRPPVVS